MKYVITYKGDVSDNLPERENASHFVNTDGNTVQEMTFNLGECVGQKRVFEVAKTTSCVKAEARKCGQILSMEIIPHPQGKEAV